MNPLWRMADTASREMNFFRLMPRVHALWALAFLTACGPGEDPLLGGVEKVKYTSTLEGYLCVPDGDGPFPVAVYNHGGLGTAIGGPPQETCVALMEEGYLGFSPLRRETVPLTGHMGDVNDGIDYALEHELADTSRLAILGFSRGGYLSVAALTQRSNATAGVIMAPAPIDGLLDEALEDANNVQASTLVLVAENDTPEFNTEDEDHVASATAVRDALSGAGKEVELEILAAYAENGHDLFQELRDSYWSKIQAFLSEKI
jgi:dienelactone hydrolase